MNTIEPTPNNYILPQFACNYYDIRAYIGIPYMSADKSGIGYSGVDSQQNGLTGIWAFF